MQFAIGIIVGVAATLAAWAYVWRMHWWARHERQVADLQRLRERNTQLAGEILELEAKLEAVTREHAVDSRAFDICEVRRVESTKRAELAEGLVRGQARHIEALESSNTKLLDSVIEMRRVGFALPSDILNSPDPEVITTVADDDLQAVKTYPHLAAADED